MAAAVAAGEPEAVAAVKGPDIRKAARHSPGGGRCIRAGAGGTRVRIPSERTCEVSGPRSRPEEACRRT